MQTPTQCCNKKKKDTGTEMATLTRVFGPVAPIVQRSCLGNNEFLMVSLNGACEFLHAERGLFRSAATARRRRSTRGELVDVGIQFSGSVKERKQLEIAREICGTQLDRARAC